MQGTVYKSTGSWYQVKARDGSFYDCRIKGKFRIQDIKSTNPVAVGDEVVFELETVAGETVGRIDEILPRRNYLVPIPRVASFEELNDHLLAACLADDDRTVDRQSVTVGEAWEQEKPYLLSLPEKDFKCCVTRAVPLKSYSPSTFH